MLETFIGGYMFHPAALDYSGDTCTNGCAYCFANINQQVRLSNLKGAIKSFYKKEPTTYKDMLLKIGYPICVSNRSDPFSRNNYLDTAALFTHLAGMPNGIFIQTKCGPGMDEAIGKLGDKIDIVFYITITTMSDDVSKRIEPFAPPTSTRLEIANKLHKAGYLVILAVNPCTESWMPRNDLESLVKWMKSNGLNHICIEILDLTRKRISILGEKRKERLGVKAIDDCKSAAVREYVRDCTEYLVRAGLSVAKKGMPFRSTFFDDIKKRFKISMPVIQDFINYLFARGVGPVYYSEFQNVIAREGIFLKTIKQNSIRDYLLRAGFVSWKANQQVHSHKELLSILWNDPRHRISLQRHCLLRLTNQQDAAGNVVMYFDGTASLGKKKEVIEL